MWLINVDRGVIKVYNVEYTAIINLYKRLSTFINRFNTVNTIITMAKEKLDVAAMTEADMQAELASMTNEYQTMKFDHAVKGLPNPLELREVRRNIARIHTEARRRELAAMTPEQLELRSKLRSRRRRQS